MRAKSTTDRSSAEPAATHRAASRRRRLWLATPLLLYLIAVVSGCMNPSVPFDCVINLGCAPVDPTLRADDDRTWVVLQHGIWRSSWALFKLERSLEAQGYRVLNPSYPSTQIDIEEQAALLRDHIEETLGGLGAPPSRIYYVGHSMGGLVIASYLRRPDARPATGSVFIGTPQRGAVMADQRGDRLLYRLLMGTHAARQLRTTDPLHRRPFQNLGAVGTVIGGRGDGEGYTDVIHGDDDNRVGVAEAHHPDEVDSVQLRMGHTRLTIADESILQVLHFLKHHRFRHDHDSATTPDSPPPR